MEKIIASFLLGALGAGVIFLLELIIELSDKISEQYGVYIYIFIAMSLFGFLIQFASDSKNK